MEARIAEIEAKLSFTEDLVEQLSATIYSQQKQIDLLQEELRVLYQQLRDVLPEESRGPVDEIPPHY